MFDTIQAFLCSVRVGCSHHVDWEKPAEIVIRLPKDGLFLSERLLSTPDTARTGAVELAHVVIRRREQASYPIFQGPAISLLTVLVIQAIHVLLREDGATFEEWPP